MSKPIIFLCSIFCTTHSQNIDIQNQNFDIKTSKLQRNHIYPIIYQIIRTSIDFFITTFLKLFTLTVHQNPNIFTMSI